MASPQVGELIEMMSTPVPAGFAELYEQHYEAVFRAALRVTGNPADAEDVLQTVFLRVLSRSERAEAARHPAAYFRRAAVNAAVDLLRRRAVHAETGYDDLGPSAGVEPAPLLKERLRRAIATLPNDDDRHREAVDLQIVAHAGRLHIDLLAVELLHHALGHRRADRVLVAAEQHRSGQTGQALSPPSAGRRSA
jgi:RNA polymerase sigma factor (sigma-70 family)